MYRLATLLALFIMLLAGCGGDSDSESDDDSKPSPPAVAKAPGKEPEDDAKDRRSPDDVDKEPSKADEPSEPKPSDAKESPEPPSSKTQLALIEAAARNALALHDLGYAGVRTRNGFRNVTVLVTRRSACRAVARDEPIMAQRIQRARVEVRKVEFEVAGTGEALGYYVLSCEQLEVPDGPGRVVFQREGVGGQVTTKPFTVRGKRWAIEWENGGNSLIVLVIPKGSKEDRETYHDPINADKRDVGRKVYSTGPGKYQLRLQGGGYWSVRVKDIR